MRIRFTEPSRSSLGLAFGLNIAAGIAIAAVFAAGTVTTVLSVRHELTRSSHVFAARWVAAVERSDAVQNALSGRLSDDDRAYLQLIANVGNVFRYEIFRPDGLLVLSSIHLGKRAAGVFAAVEALRYDPHEPSVVRHAGPGTDLPETYVVSVLPIRSGGELVGLVRVYIDQTAGAEGFNETLVWSLILIGLLAGLGLANCAGLCAHLVKQGERHDRIVHLAHHDALTGLANRNRFQTVLARCLEDAADGKGPVALHMIDLDGFKAVNDTLGHDAGDHLLQALAGKLVDCVRVDDVVARLGGDEFAVIQRDVVDERDARMLAERLVDAGRAIRELDGVPVSVSVSVGVALAPAHTRDASDLLKCADAALYRGKSGGRDQYALFELGMDEEMHARNTLRMMLRRAVEAQSFHLHYQPLHGAADGSLTGFEALLRLPDGEGELISPTRFIPLAEEMGLTPKLGAWVMDEACRTALDWPEHLTVAVNLSPQQFGEDIVAVVEAALEKSGLAPHRLELEITESLLISDPRAVDAQLRRIKALGVLVVMDDFGTGYSSLSYLWKFPFDKLKVDRSCFMSLGQSENVGEVLRTISAMSGAMKLKVVAEGIETEAQRSFARASGYDELQGFLYGRPMPVSDVGSYIDRATASELTTAALGLDSARA